MKGIRNWWNTISSFIHVSGILDHSNFQHNNSFLYYLIIKSCYEIVVMSKLTQDFSCLARRDRVMSLMGVQSCWGSCGKVYEWHIPIIEHRIEHQTFSMKVKVCPDIGGMPCAHHATLCTIGCRGDYLAYNPCLKHSFQALFHNVSTFLNSMLHGLTLHAISVFDKVCKWSPEKLHSKALSASKNLEVKNTSDQIYHTYFPRQCNGLLNGDIQHTCQLLRIKNQNLKNQNLKYDGAKRRHPRAQSVRAGGGWRGGGCPPSHDRETFAFSTCRSCISLHFLKQIYLHYHCHNLI